jgi:hypothetical protein
MITLTAIHVYPVKSCAGLALETCEVEPRGLAEDRRWMVIDASNRFITGRQHGKLVLVRATPTADGLELAAPGMPTLAIARPAATAPRRRVVVWRSEVDAPDAGANAAEWFTRYLGVPAGLVYMDTGAVRPITGKHAANGDTVSFADGYPQLLISEASLAELSRRLATPVPMARFRPNLVIAGCEAHAEDGWKRVRIGAVEFDVVKTCTRCVFTTVDATSGERDPSGEPLATLKSYRRNADGVIFGMNLIARSQGRIAAGTPVEVIA